MAVKLLTLVVPTYNMEKYISRCLESVTDKRLPDTLEVVVVNDGSKDNSLDIIRHFENLRPDIVRVVDKENGHYGSCVNAGLRIAQGKYFRMLDADDWVNTDALIELLKRLETCDADLVVTLRTEHITKRDGSKIVKTLPFRTVEYGKIYDVQSFDIAAHATHHELNMHSMAYKTEVLRHVGLKHIEGICYTDLQYCFLPIDRIKTLIVFDLYLYNYFIGRDDQSTSTRSLARNFTHIVKVVSFMFDYLGQCKVSGGTTFRNQHYFLQEAFEIFLVSLRLQRNVRGGQEYQDILGIMRNAEKYNVQSRLFDRYYFKIWRKTGSRHVLNCVLKIYRMVHYRKLKNAF